MPPKPKFQDGEKVLCFHGPLVYEAKTVKCEVKEKTVRYFVHYNGWNKSWDEWVPESRVLKCNDAGYQKQKELKRAHEAKQKSNRAAAAKLKAKEKEKAAEAEQEKDTPEPEKKPVGRRKESKERSGTPTVEKRKAAKEKEKDKDKDKDKDDDWEKGSTKSEEGSLTSRKRPRAVKEKEKPAPKEKETQKEKEESKKEKVSEKDDDGPKKKRTKIPEAAVETEETFLTRIEVKIKIPDELKPWLVDDFDLITRQKHLVQAPCKNHVENILEEYIKSKAAKATALQKEAIQEVTQGIKDYFNVMLGSQLLYKFERAQYSEMLADYPDKPMSQIYGAVHLLRLFIKLGGMLAYTPLDEKSMHLLLSHLHDFLKYMSRNAHNLFSVTDYVVAPPEYHRKAL